MAWGSGHSTRGWRGEVGTRRQGVARARTTFEGDGRPSSAAIHALVATRASRSTPVAHPGPVQRPDEVLGREVAGRGLRVGAAAEATGGRVDHGDPVAQRRHRVGQRLAVGVVEVHGDPVGGDPPLAERLEQAVHVAGRADPDRVAEAQLVAAEIHQPLGHVDDLGDRDRPLPRVAEAHRDVGAHPHPARPRPLDDGSEHRELLGDRPVEVLLGEGLRRRPEDRDRRQPQLLRAVEAPLVGHERRPPSTGRVAAGLPQPLQDLLGIAHLRAPSARGRTRWSRWWRARPPRAGG